MANSTSISIPPDIAKVTAPILFGPMINWGLYGVLCVQTYVYSYNFPDDRWYLKALAYSVFLVETVQTALTGADVYFWFMAGFGNVERLKDSNFSPIDSPTIDAFISLIVQGFFCYRIWTLNKRALWICLLIAVLAIAQAVGAAWGGIQSAILGTYSVVKPGQYLWLIPSALADILIALVLTFQLRQSGAHGGRYSDHVVPRIVRLTIETNTLTASVAVVSFVLYIAFPNEIYYTCPTGVIGKLYSNTLFVTLNNRIYFRDHPPPHGFTGLANSSRRSSAPQTTALSLNFAPQTQSSLSGTSTDTSVGPGLDLLHPTLMVDPEKGVNAALVVS